MKAFLQHNESGLYLKPDGEWGRDPETALKFQNTADAENFRAAQNIPAVHPVLRIDPVLLTRMSARAPGAYQIGE